MSVENNILSVSAVTQIIKKTLEGQELLKYVMISGEISNFKYHSTSGHLYFSLKDTRAIINCVMFKSKAQKLLFKPESGDQVLLVGNISVYEKSGSYQVYVEKMLPEGSGAQAIALKALKEKLTKEGILKSEEEKRRLPKYPEKIGIVTSETGAVIRDLVTVLQRRWPSIHILLSPARVQGLKSDSSIIKALDNLYQRPDLDLIILARGGGSVEDLWTFNEEELVRFIAKSPVPIISAIGHETDTTLSDFAADLRAGTPSIAAELAVPDRVSEVYQLQQKTQYLNEQTTKVVKQAYDNLDRKTRDIFSKDLGKMFSDYHVEIDHYLVLIQHSLERHFSDLHAGHQQRLAQLRGLDPLAILERGYVICHQGEQLISRVEDIDRTKDLNIKLVNGEVTSKVEEIYENGK